MTQPTTTAEAASPPAGPADQTSLGSAVRLVAALARPRIGWILAGLGVLAIFIAWVQAADELFVARQIPYVISGGLGGLGLIVLGGVLLHAHDLYRYTDRLDRVEQKVDDIHRAMVAAGEIVGLGEADGAVVMLPTGSTYHVSSCPAIKGKQTTTIDSAEAAAQQGRAACKLCAPPDATAPAH